jgi:hypothetical protein
VEADAGGQDAGGASELELLRFDELGQGWEDDDVELPWSAGPARAVECGTAVSISGGCAKAGDAEYTERCKCARCTAGSEEPVAAVSVSGRAAGGIFFLFKFGGCEAGAAWRIAGCGELGSEQFELQFGLGLLELEV